MAIHGTSRCCGRRSGAVAYAVFAILVLVLASCATSVTKQEQEPISKNTAVVKWTDSARELRDGKQFEQAAARLERALRVEPGNAWLWYELAQVHLAQGSFDQAIQFAYKSDALTGDERLKSHNRRLINKAKTQLEKVRDLQHGS